MTSPFAFTPTITAPGLPESEFSYAGGAPAGAATKHQARISLTAPSQAEW